MAHWVNFWVHFNELVLKCSFEWCDKVINSKFSQEVWSALLLGSLYSNERFCSVILTKKSEKYRCETAYTYAWGQPGKGCPRLCLYTDTDRHITCSLHVCLSAWLSTLLQAKTGELWADFHFGLLRSFVTDVTFGSLFLLLSLGYLFIIHTSTAFYFGQMFSWFNFLLWVIGILNKENSYRITL
mgnify:CR=1 FL=1